MVLVPFRAAAKKLPYAIGCAHQRAAGEFRMWFCAWRVWQWYASLVPRGLAPGAAFHERHNIGDGVHRGRMHTRSFPALFRVKVEARAEENGRHRAVRSTLNCDTRGSWQVHRERPAGAASFI
jgi:hypothetical protein